MSVDSIQNNPTYSSQSVTNKANPSFCGAKSQYIEQEDDSFTRMRVEAAIGGSMAYAYSLIKKAPDKLKFIGESILITIGAVELTRGLIKGIGKLMAKKTEN